MDKISLIRELNFLGVDEHTWPVLALLPLIQVAWADGEIQEKERELILDLADTEYCLDEIGRIMLDNWLAHPPTENYLARGRAAARLLNRASAATDLNTALDHAEAVAKSAGGLFGFRSVDPRERAALDEIASALELPVNQPWDWADQLDQDCDEIEAERRASVVPAQPRQTGPEDALTTADTIAPDDVIETLEADFSQDSLGAEEVSITFQPALNPAHGAAILTRIDTDESYALPASGLTVGRSRTNDLWIRQDPMISRQHCRLFFDDGSIWLEDKESTTGTFVNEERVRLRRLYGGESLQFGDLHFTFRCPK